MSDDQILALMAAAIYSGYICEGGHTKAAKMRMSVADARELLNVARRGDDQKPPLDSWPER